MSCQRGLGISEETGSWCGSRCCKARRERLAVVFLNELLGARRDQFIDLFLDAAESVFLEGADDLGVILFEPFQALGWDGGGGSLLGSLQLFHPLRISSSPA